MRFGRRNRNAVHNLSVQPFDHLSCPTAVRWVWIGGIDAKSAGPVLDGHIGLNTSSAVLEMHSPGNRRVEFPSAIRSAGKHGISNGADIALWGKVHVGEEIVR